MRTLTSGGLILIGTGLAMHPTLVGALISVGMALLGAALTVLVNRFLKSAERREKYQGETVRRIGELEKQIAVIGQAVVPISAAFQALLVKELTHYHTPVMDALLVKLGPPCTLTEAEEAELIAALEQRTKDMGDLIDDSEREAAAMMPLVMRRARREARGTPGTETQIVGLPKESEEKTPKKGTSE